MAYRDMVVIFLDVLGSREMRDFNTKFEIHSLFHGSVRESRERQKSDQLSHVIYDRSLYGFSDCAYIFYYYKDGIDECRKDKDKLLSVALYNTSILLTRIMSRGYTVRGGVTYGEAYLDEEGFFGPAVERAYKLESEDAKFPRVLVDAEIGARLYEFESSVQSDAWSFGIESKIRDFLPRLVLREEDGFYLNIFYHLEREGSLMYEGDELDIESVRSVLLNRIEGDMVRLAHDPRVISKLEWLKGYLLKLQCSLKEGVVTFSSTI